MFLCGLINIQLLMTIKPAHKILSLTYRNCWGKPNIWILPLHLQKNKYGCSQLYWDQIFSHTIYLYNRKFDWWLIVDPIWLVWHTYISHWSTHWSTHWITGHPKTQTKQTADCRPCRLSTFFLALVFFVFTFGSHIFWLWAQISVRLHFGMFVMHRPR